MALQPCSLPGPGVRLKEALRLARPEAITEQAAGARKSSVARQSDSGPACSCKCKIASLRFLFVFLSRRNRAVGSSNRRTRN